MASSTRQNNQVTSDAVSEVTLLDNASTYSRAETVVEKTRGIKDNIRQQFRNLRTPPGQPGQPGTGTRADPNKNWEARCHALR